MTNATVFPLELLKLVNAWQIGGTQKDMHRVADQIAQFATDLPSQFTTCREVVYRKLSLKKSPLWLLLARGKLSGTATAWTRSLSVAKRFKGGVPPAEWQGLILRRQPPSCEVLLNLHALHADLGFQQAMRREKHNIPDFKLGLDRYKGSQQEIILKRSTFGSADVHILGGYSSDLNHVGMMIFGREPNSTERKIMRTWLSRKGKSIGAWWLSPRGTASILIKIQPQIDRLKRDITNARRSKMPSVSSHPKPTPD